jgi:hypothetical protein
MGFDIAFGMPNVLASQSLTSVTTGAADATRSNSPTSSPALASPC